MELEQINKQVNWLDEERRKDKLIIGSLEERLNNVEARFAPIETKDQEFESDFARFSGLLNKVGEFEEALLNIRIDTTQHIEILEKQTKKREEDAEKIRRAEMRSLETGITETRKELEQFAEIKRNLKNRVEEELRLSRMIDEVRARVETLKRSDEEYIRTIRVLEDGRRQDSKRITDLAGETSAIRKRTDEHGGKIELNVSTVKKIETRMSELATVESERKEAIANFIDSQALREIERERLWKEWQTRFNQIESQSSEIESSLQSLDATQRAIRTSQQTVDEITQKLERRINEITEVQRLTEERFRQEWATFKADDQKRWTNYILTMDEQRNETQRQHEKLVEKVTNIEDEIQELQDLLQQANEHTEKRLQSMLAMTHEWVSSYERTVGRAR